MADIMTPALGESVSEATVARWAKKPGEAVRKDEILVELETDKVSLEVAAPADGVLESISAEEGATVEPGAQYVPDAHVACVTVSTQYLPAAHGFCAAEPVGQYEPDTHSTASLAGTAQK